ncbi:SUMO ligase siz1 [Nowakowskiella sp. JEL0078]|nr:SUMO ligase siz1 [Nowakowskiella sp. JEL0078]
MLDLKVSGLKDILRQCGERVSGNKNELRERISKRLTTFSHHGATQKIAQISASVHNRVGRLIPGNLQEMLDQNYSPVPATKQKVTSPVSSSTSAITSSISIKPTPFYELEERVSSILSIDWRTHPYAVRTLRIEFSLTETQSRLITTSPTANTQSYRIYLFCVSTDLSNPKYSTIEYPSGFQLAINSEQHPQALTEKCKGTKKRPWTAKAIDITNYCRIKIPGVKNKIDVSWTELSSKLPIGYILSKIIEKNSVLSEKVITEMKSKSGPIDEDIVETSTTISLCDPYSRLRIKTPVRSTSCNHLQCFDCETFFNMMEKVPNWICPVCSLIIGWETIFVDGYFQELLQKANIDSDQVEIAPDFSWKVVSSIEADPLDEYDSESENCSFEVQKLKRILTPPENQPSNSNIIDLTLDSDDDDDVTIQHTDTQIRASTPIPTIPELNQTTTPQSYITPTVRNVAQQTQHIVVGNINSSPLISMLPGISYLSSTQNSPVNRPISPVFNEISSSHFPSQLVSTSQISSSHVNNTSNDSLKRNDYEDTAVSRLQVSSDSTQSNVNRHISQPQTTVISVNDNLRISRQNVSNNISGFNAHPHIQTNFGQNPPWLQLPSSFPLMNPSLPTNIPIINNSPHPLIFNPQPANLPEMQEAMMQQVMMNWSSVGMAAPLGSHQSDSQRAIDLLTRKRVAESSQFDDDTKRTRI